MGDANATGSSKNFIVTKPDPLADAMAMLEIFHPARTSLESFFGDLEVPGGLLRLVPDEGIREKRVLLFHLDEPVHELLLDFWELGWPRKKMRSMHG